MAEASIAVAVRVRPFSAHEASQLAPQDGPLPFLGDGGLGASPIKPPPTGATALRTRFLRPIIHTVDEKVLVFDPPDNNPLSRLYSQQPSFLSNGQRKAKDARYAFDRVFDDKCTQRDVFEGTVKPLLDGVLTGYNASVFAYGATGCGKTHTISGSPEDPGVIFLTMQALYERIADSKSTAEVHVRLAYLEIYNETIRDLLSDEPTPRGQGLQLREDQANKISVMGITEHAPETPEHVLEMIREGNQRRTMSPTEANAVSSRSHAVLQINVTARPRTGDVMDETTSASLNIIDLAGSERASATNNNGARMKEGANINKSLLALGNCINALCSTGMKGRHIPYRNSKLTRLLKFSLGGNCKTVMIVCVSPSSGHYEETLNTLKYANQAKNIRTKVSQNLVNVDRHVAQYVQTIAQLRQEIMELKGQVSEKGSIESESEKRKKREAVSEMSEVLTHLQRRVKQTKAEVSKHSESSAAVNIAALRLSHFKTRLAEIDISVKNWAATATPGEEEPTELTSERQFLQQLVKADEAFLRSSEQDHSRLENQVNLLYSQLNSACRNSKFDAETSEKVKYATDALKAEVEAERHRSTTRGIVEHFRTEVGRSLGWLTAATRGTVDMKNAAGELEWRASQEGEEWTAVSTHLKQVAEHLRQEAKHTDDLFQAVTGSSTKSRANFGGTGVRRTASSAVRRSRASLTGARPSLAGPSSSRPSLAPPPPVGAVKPKSALRRSSIQPAGMRPLASSSTLSSPRKARNSLLGQRAAPASPGKLRKRVSLMPAAAAPRRPLASSPDRAAAPRAVSHGSKVLPNIEPAKGGIRWADEAGEGSIDDHGRNPASGPRRSPTPTSAPSDVSSSGTEWEDIDSLKTMTAPTNRPTAPPPAVRSKPARQSLFGNNSLVPKAATRALNLSSVAENEVIEEEEDEDDEASPADSSRDFGKLFDAPSSSSSSSSSSAALTKSKRAGFSAPTMASQAKASRVPLEEAAGQNENVSFQTAAALRNQNRSAPYSRRESHIGPARSRPSIGTNGISLANTGYRRTSSAEVKGPPSFSAVSAPNTTFQSTSSSSSNSKPPLSSSALYHTQPPPPPPSSTSFTALPSNGSQLLKPRSSSAVPQGSTSIFSKLSTSALPPLSSSNHHAHLNGAVGPTAVNGANDSSCFNPSSAANSSSSSSSSFSLNGFAGAGGSVSRGPPSNTAARVRSSGAVPQPQPQPQPQPAAATTTSSS